MTLLTRVVLTPQMLAEFPGLLDDAISRAIRIAAIRVERIAKTETPVGDPTNYGYTSTGRVPGALRESFKSKPTARGLSMKWSAIWKGFDYARVVEKGRTDYNPFPGRHYAAATKQRAREILLEELLREFEAL